VTRHLEAMKSRVSIAVCLAVFATVRVVGGEPEVAPAADATAFTKPSRSELRKRLTPTQFSVTQDADTERPFHNEFWDSHAAGIYVDVVSGEPLFSSTDKYDSGTGWPSFTKPIDEAAVVERRDDGLFGSRTEVRSRKADSHLGHVFDDGPAPTGTRYCMNSAALRFVPAEKLVESGYDQYASLFPDVKQTVAAKPAEAAPAKAEAARETAYLAGGCFWGMQDILRKIPGVVATDVGYTGGVLANPTYEDVHGGDTGHAEAVRVVFDPTVLSYEALLGWFFRMHDPTTPNRQGNDVGTQYRSAIFYLNDDQRKTAEKVKAAVDASGKWKKPVVTQIAQAGAWYPAEDHHQDYLVKNPGGYTCHYLRD
jgi:peptide methionine sulfoxide reductase msrA/msrB